MCEECGCGLGATSAVSRRLEYAGGSRKQIENGHASGPESVPGGTQWVHVQRSLLEGNQTSAEANRVRFRDRGILALNLVSAPGSGKTALIEKTALMLQPSYRVGAIVGDLETDNDAVRLRAAGIPVVQVTTGTLCHLEAVMVGRALDDLGEGELDFLFIENVGNLVCPAAYDLGEKLRVVLLSVTEGEDKPLKYPPLFHSADVAMVTKTDLASAAGFDHASAMSHLAKVSHHARILEVSSRTGQGMGGWIRLLVESLMTVRKEAGK